MIRTRLRLALPVVAALGLSGCGGGAAGLSEIAGRSTPAGIAPELVYVTEIDGFDLATQSVGVSGDDGLSATYVNGNGATVTLSTRSGSDPSATACADLPDGASGPDLRCAVRRDDVTVVLTGQDGAEPIHLRAAADAVRVPSKNELEHLFSDVPAGPKEPVERGDLPGNGDGAPIDEPGPGG